MASDTAMVLPEHCSSSTAAPCWQGETKGLESQPVFLKRVKYLKKPQLPFVIPPRLLLLPLKPRVWLLLPRNIVGPARHENKQASLNRHCRLPAQGATQQQFSAAALYSAISKDSPKCHTCPSAWRYWMTSICAVFSSLALKSLVSEISSFADATPLCQISFNEAAAEKTGYLFVYCRYVSLWSIKLQAKFCKLLSILVS